MFLTTLCVLVIFLAPVSLKLLEIHRQGVEVYFTVNYRAKLSSAEAAESRRLFGYYLIFLWLIEVLAAFFIAVTAAICILY